ncbi:MAG TPA: class I SAM-dependent methyltransferase [Steroidobacteraceae bacterium]|nr:class I SAM-dependent methyltransferase [Steroidobacteraceae bacterium]
MKVSPHDPGLILQKLLRPELLRRINPLALSHNARVRARWGRPDEVVRHWTQIPLVVQRLNERITGRADVTFKDLVCREYFADGKARTAVSFGCGSGDRELDWARRGVFASLTGLDLSPSRIAAARRAAGDAGLSQSVSFEVADVASLSSDSGRYDVVLFEHSLHHFSNVDRVLDGVRRILKPDGLLIVDEFVGPRRFQWSAAQLAFADAILACLPRALREMPGGHRVKTRHYRAGELLMWLNDPSEAIESNRIEPEIHRQFRVLRALPYGGTISHLVFHDIAHHFAGDDPDAARWVRLVLDAEDALLRLGILPSDFACYVAAP